MVTGKIQTYYLVSKLMVVCRLHGEDNVAIKRYVISFWNGVDLRYKLLQGPSVKISIAGIIISRVTPTLTIIDNVMNDKG